MHSFGPGNDMANFIQYFFGFFRILARTRSPIAAVTSVVSGKGVIGRSVFLRSVRINGRYKISDGCRIYGARLSGDIEIGRYTSMNGPGITVFSKLNSVRIGSFCSIARNVQIQEYNHDFSRPSSYFMMANIFNRPLSEDVVSKGSIVIGHDVWVGANAVILSGVEIGNGAIVAAGSVVTKNVPPYAIVGGVPAKVLSRRFTDLQIEALVRDDWYSWPLSKILEHQQYFAYALRGCMP